MSFLIDLLKLISVIVDAVTQMAHSVLKIYYVHLG